MLRSLFFGLIYGGHARARARGPVRADVAQSSAAGDDWRQPDMVQSGKDCCEILSFIGRDQPEPDEPSDGAVLHLDGKLQGCLRERPVAARSLRGTGDSIL